VVINLKLRSEINVFLDKNDTFQGDISLYSVILSLGGA